MSNMVNIGQYNSAKQSSLASSIIFQSVKGSWDQKGWELLLQDMLLEMEVLGCSFCTSWTSLYNVTRVFPSGCTSSPSPEQYPGFLYRIDYLREPCEGGGFQKHPFLPSVSPYLTHFSRWIRFEVNAIVGPTEAGQLWVEFLERRMD